MLAPDGIEHLGGADVDEAMTQLVLRSLADRLDGADLDDPATVVGLARLRRDCVEAKEALSGDTEVTVPVALPGVNTTVRINRAELEALTRPALLDTVAAVRRTLTSAGIEARDLRAIVLVGGSSRMPLVRELLQRAFPVSLSIDTHPKHDVALGAALLCRTLRTVELADDTTTADQSADVSGSSPWYRRRRFLALAAAVVVVLVGVAITVANLPSRNADLASETGSSQPSTAVTGVPTADELLSHIPADYRDSCQPTETDMRAATVKLVCPITGSKVSLITQYQYDSEDAYDRAVSAAMTQTTSSDCLNGPGQDHYSLTTPSGEQRSGILACEAATPVITFTTAPISCG